MQMCGISTEFVLDRFLFHWANSQVANQYSYDDICHFYKAPSLAPMSAQRGGGGARDRKREREPENEAGRESEQCHSIQQAMLQSTLHHRRRRHGRLCIIPARPREDRRLTVEQRALCRATRTCLDLRQLCTIDWRVYGYWDRLSSAENPGT
ncbi:hypothetical protein QQF64_020958 [Cirrhinus molitorella]|uniref:Uncharacterized protein n=1 Tax=Cirrhinus molitorella TaxID=172907 RepID=A0ABR3LAR3_9TELE